MASIVGRPLAVGPGLDTRRSFDSGTDPTLLSDPLTTFFGGTFSQLSHACQAPSVGTGDDFATKFGGSSPPETLDTDMLVDGASDSTRRDSLLPCEFDDEQHGTTSLDTKNPQTTSDSYEPPEPGGRRKGPRKSTKRRHYETAGTAQARAKREVSLEKNRLAANKCRKKKRVWMDSLENKHGQLSAHNKLLRAELGELNDSVYSLKGLVFRHADCGFPPIDEYVRREAEQVQAMVRGSLPS